MQNESTGVWGRIDPNELAKSNTQLTEMLHPVLAAAGVGAWRYEVEKEHFYFDELLRTLYETDPFGPIAHSQIAGRVHPNDRDNWRSSLDDCPPGGVFHSRHRVVLSDGAERWFDWTGNLSSEPGTRIVLGICVDVTEEIAIQRKLHAEERRFQAMASGVPGNFGYMDRDYRVQFLSREYCDTLGVSSEDAIGRHTIEVFGQAAFDQMRPLFDRALAGEIVEFEDSQAINEAPERHYAVHYQPDVDKHGNVRGLFTLRIDITQRRELEESLRKLSENLQRSNADLEQFAYVASHDLKAPLRSIQVLVEWLTEDLGSYNEGDVQENLSLLSKRTTRLNNLLDDLLNYSRVGRDSKPPVAVDVASMVSEISDLMNAEGFFNIHMQGQSQKLETDPAALHQVLRNLIGNAIKHHPGPDGEVAITVLDRDSHYEFEVADNGPGIAEEFWEKIFKMFQTLKPRDEVEGSGMGLAIVRRIVRSQGGRIWIEKPEKGIGAVFKFTWAKRPLA